MKYIHIGFPKSGTTWLQQVVFPEWMAQNAVAYFTRVDGYEFHQTPYDKILFSKEGIIGTWVPVHKHVPDAFNVVTNMVELFGRDVKVIITERSPEVMHDSLYKHLLMAGDYSEKKPTLKFLKHFRDMLLEALHHYDISFIVLNIENVSFYRQLADFMGIGYPYYDQKIRWHKRVNQSFPNWIYPVFRLLNRFKYTNTIRKIIIFIVRLFIK
jgi:hypothetical protein